MISKETVRNLILDIRKATKLSQAGIAMRAGFKPESLSQQISREESLESIHSRLLNEFAEELEHPKDAMFQTATYTTKTNQGKLEDKKMPDIDVIRHYEELVKQLQETVKQQKTLIDKLLEKT